MRSRCLEVCSLAVQGRALFHPGALVSAIQDIVNDDTHAHAVEACATSVDGSAVPSSEIEAVKEAKSKPAPHKQSTS